MLLVSLAWQYFCRCLLGAAEGDHLPSEREGVSLKGPGGQCVLGGSFLEGANNKLYPSPPQPSGYFLFG